MREAAGAPQRSITAAYADSGQARIKLVGAAVHDAGERISAGINEDLRGIETGVLNGNKGLVAGETETGFIQDARRKCVRVIDESRITARRVAIASFERNCATRESGAPILRPAHREMVFFAERVVHLGETSFVEGRRRNVGDEVVYCARRGCEVGKGPKLEQGLGDGISHRSPFRGGGHASGADLRSNLTEAFIGRKEE